MKTSKSLDFPLCSEFQTGIGITARSALDTKKRELVGDFKAVGLSLIHISEPTRPY